METLKAEYADIMARLDQLLENSRISAYTRKIIMKMSDKVLEDIAQKYEYVREGVKSVMGGKVLEHEAEAILREGWKQEREEGPTIYFARNGWAILYANGKMKIAFINMSCAWLNFFEA